MKFYIWAFALMLCAAPAAARPISYAGGWSLMQMNDAFSSHLNVFYSPTADYSVGYLGEYWREKDWLFQGVQGTYLLKRFNLPKSQANFYFTGAGGAAIALNKDHKEAATFGGFAADWEDRRFFVSYENMALHAGSIDSFFTQKGRVGIAPYIGDYGDLHTWLMLQLDHRPYGSDELILTPLVRLFYGDTLAEAGVNDRGDVLFNLMINF